MTKLLVAAVFAATVFLGALPQSAAAHASLVSTDPADGSTVESAPRTVRMTFNEGIRLADVSISKPDGGLVATGEPTIDGVNVAADVSPTAQRGEYTVTYRVVSEDGHTVFGEFRFTATTGEAVERREAPVESTSSSEGGVPVIVIVLGVVGLLVVALALRARQRESQS